jgi:hypothetical protein
LELLGDEGWRGSYEACVGDGLGYGLCNGS